MSDEWIGDAINDERESFSAQKGNYLGVMKQTTTERNALGSDEKVDGTLVYDRTLAKHIWWDDDASAWKDISGATV